MTRFDPRTVLVAAALIFACNRVTPTEPNCITTPVFLTQSFYVERSEVEQTWSGTIGKPCPPPTAGGRDLCYALDGMPLYAESAAARAIVDPLVGVRVVVRGKLVDLGYGPEIWPASVTACR